MPVCVKIFAGKKKNGKYFRNFPGIAVTILENTYKKEKQRDTAVTFGMDTIWKKN